MFVKFMIYSNSLSEFVECHPRCNDKIYLSKYLNRKTCHCFACQSSPSFFRFSQVTATHFYEYYYWDFV